MALTRREISARYRARHLEKERARMRAYRKRWHAEHRKESIAASKAYHSAHRDEQLARRKAQWAIRTELDRVKDKARRVQSRDLDNERRRLKRAADPGAARKKDAGRRLQPGYSERAVARTAKWAREHPEWARALRHIEDAKRRAREKQVFVEAVDPRVVFERDRGMCGICLEPVDPMGKWEVDHIMPISKGGPHSYANVQLAHQRCNRAKGARCA